MEMRAQTDGTTLVNPRQYERIMKRRIARAKLDSLRKADPERKNYMHESRHKHACRRKRGPGGRFLTKAELAVLKAEADARLPAADAAAPSPPPSPPAAAPAAGAAESATAAAADADSGANALGFGVPAAPAAASEPGPADI